ncbi:hypothetical protein [uncultured Lacinutrix sp.]|uniref:hypothetical protein n=1 Tax=uncultured Lacinutrix sp. TaxID=574032 RepID=UPI0026102A3D|nr:hypothetical protein [uncultured Lacinutrix sp.]
MKNTALTFLIIVLNLNLSFSQTKSEIDSLLNGISETENSIGITKTEQAKKIIAFGENSLIILAEFFTDSTLTKVKSECQKRILTKGEIAIIIADRIEGMPYFTITGIQNCTMTFCENNPNLIEYYLWDSKKNETEKFKEKYLVWLESDDRIDWTPLLDYKSKKVRKKEIRKRKREKKKTEKRFANNGYN